MVVVWVPVTMLWVNEGQMGELQTLCLVFLS